MESKTRILIVAAAVAIALTIAAGQWKHFPGDVAATRFVQAVLPDGFGWAKTVTATAKSPWNFVLLALTVGISWRLGGWRAALASLLSFGGMWVLGLWLGPPVGRPRPSPDLVLVPEKLSGFSFPSIFGLTYASTIGFLAVLLAGKGRGAVRLVGLAVCCALLVVGGTARVRLAAHWPSDVLISYLIGLVWAWLLIRFACPNREAR